MKRRWLRAMVAIAWLVAVSLPVAVRAADATFEPPSATARLGEPLVFRDVVTVDEPPLRIELVSSLPGSTSVTVTAAELTETGDGVFEAVVEQDGHVTPNTTFEYHFRAVLPDGTTVEGPEATATVVDDRFDWKTIEGPIVRLHWYAGSDAFGQRALDIGEQAIADASALLGVTETEPVDFLIYDSEEAFRDALGPGTRENVGGQANPATRILVGLIEPTEIDSDWVDILVTHELTHLVFATAIKNPYHGPPRWLNEGLAVFLSEGYGLGDRTTVLAAAAARDLIPLEGLGGFFPTTRDRFGLAYAESVSAVSYFIDTYGQDQLVALIRSYSGGVTDDEAFMTATGADMAAFDGAWAASLSTTLPEPRGPQPAPPGPLPSDWVAAQPDSSAEPAASQPAASASDRPTATQAATPPPDGEGSFAFVDDVDPVGAVLISGVIAVGVVLAALVVLKRA